MTEQELTALAKRTAAPHLSRVATLADVVALATGYLALIADRDALKERLEQALAFIKGIATTELCADERKEFECCDDSGPYCGSHEWFDMDDVLRARALLAKLEIEP